ncbi:MAG: SDR family oxidoreductase [Candidatus Riflebacteria bacterium]|nr:SDR family oxidoreductase [Candidatus Riflebacteria bacterium]
MAKVLVTGGAGFIGSHLVEELIRRGDQVRVLDDFSSGNRDNISQWRNEIELVEGDVRDAQACERAMAGIEIVFHEAAVASVPRSVSDPWMTNAVNLDGTLRLLISARDAGVRRFLFASSSAIYGDAPELPKTEDHMPKPISPYALHKLASEHYLQLFKNLYGLETVSFRYFNVFGPRQDPKSEYAAVIPKFITRMLAGKAPIIYGDGLQTRDFIFVKDVVAANIMASHESAAPGHVFNLARGNSITLRELVAMLNEVIETSFVPEFAPPAAGDVRDSQASVDLARKLLKFEPKVSMTDGLRQTVEWYRKCEARSKA